jgi:hypothetical protein
MKEFLKIHVEDKQEKKKKKEWLRSTGLPIK